MWVIFVTALSEIYLFDFLLSFTLVYVILSLTLVLEKGRTATTRRGVTRKRRTKRLKNTGNLFTKNLQLKDVC